MTFGSYHVYEDKAYDNKKNFDILDENMPSNE
jgi:hypothetical protein